MLLKHLKELTKDTAIYGFSKVVGKVVSFLLLPIYTAYFTTADYGILSILGISGGALSLMMVYAMDSAAYRYVGLNKDQDERAKYAFNAHTFVVLSAILPTIAIIFLLESIAGSLLDDENLWLFVLITYLGILCSTVSAIPLAVLRIDRRPKIVALGSIMNVFVSIGASLLLVVVFEVGVIGAILGNAIGNLVSSVYLSINVRIWKIAPIDFKVLKELAIYAAPMYPHKVFALIIPLYAQYILKYKIDLATLGLYAVALKFTVPYTTFIGMVQQAWGPYKFEIINKDPEPKTRFRNLMNIYVVLSILIYTTLATVGQWILIKMTAPAFHEAANYLPMMALIPLSQGLYFMFATGTEFAKSPIWNPVFSGSALLSFILLMHFNTEYSINYIAGSIALSYIVMALGVLMYAHKLFPIPYNWKFLLPIILVIPLLVVSFSDQLISTDYRYLCLLGLAFFVGIILTLLVLINYKTLNYKKLLQS